MEQHPVPRNISSFQFHLIGDMTVRQFAYLAGGAVGAFILYKLLPFPGLITYPIVGIVGFSGFALAFLPIQERPLDKWLLAFIKSINSPTQYLWHKEALIPDIFLKSYAQQSKKVPDKHQEAHQDAQKKLEQYLATLPHAPHQKLNIREKHYIDSTLKLFETNAGYIPQPVISPQIPPVPNKSGPAPGSPATGGVQSGAQTGQVIPQPTPIKTEPKPVQPRPAPINPAPLPPQVQPAIKQPPAPIQSGPIPALQIDAKGEIKPIPAPDSPDLIGVQAGQPLTIPAVKSIEDQKLDKIIKEKQALEDELKKLKASLDNKEKPQVVKPQKMTDVPKPTIKAVTPKIAQDEIGIPKLPQVPNLIMGVIKDTQRKLLPNIILTVKDTQGVPHRALKTNRLGQFSTATPLSNGTYYLEAEDPLKRYIFDIAEIVLAGKVFPAIEMDAKGEKEMMREQLSKELFGSQGAY